MSETLLGVFGSLAIISCWGAIILAYEYGDLKEKERKEKLENVKWETCVTCNTRVYITKDTPIDNRAYYVDGSGQMCYYCYQDIYNNK